MEQEMNELRPMNEASGTIPAGVEKEYKPRKQELLREHEIRLRFLSVGCVVSVGCREIPFRDVNEAMVEINKYVSNPYEQGKRWREIFNSEE
jgi:hypothetical protein